MDSSRILTGLSQYPVFKVQAQRGDTLPMSLPAVNRFSQPISELLARPLRCRTPPPFWPGASVPCRCTSTAGPASLSDRPHGTSFFQDVRASDVSVRAALISYHPRKGHARGVWKVLQKFFAREPISPRSVRNGACPPAVRDPQARSRTRRTHPGRGPPALHRSSPHPP